MLVLGMEPGYLAGSFVRLALLVRWLMAHAAQAPRHLEV